MKSLDEKRSAFIVVEVPGNSPTTLQPCACWVCMGCGCATRCVALSQPTGSRQALAVCCCSNLSQRGINFLVDFTAPNGCVKGS